MFLKKDILYAGEMKNLDLETFFFTLEQTLNELQALILYNLCI